MTKIFIAEDDRFLGNAYRLKFTKAGFIVKIVVDGQELLDLVSVETPDLIILDIMMPVKDGFTTLQELKAHKDWKHIPVVVASNLGQREDLDNAKQLGAIDYFVKSELSIEEIAQKIIVLLFK